jgi:hypothetical protein
MFHLEAILCKSSKKGTADLGSCINVKYSIQLLKLKSFMEIFDFIAEMPLEISI